MSRTALFVRWVLGITAVIFVGLGLIFMFGPGLIIDGIGLKAETKVAIADIRAVYGGIDLAIGVLLAIFFFRKQFANGLAIALLTFACLAGGRLVGILVDQAHDFITFGLFASEVLGAVLSAVAWFLARQPEPVPAAAVVAPATELKSTTPTPEA